jgi:lysozyme
MKTIITTLILLTSNIALAQGIVYKVSDGMVEKLRVTEGLSLCAHKDHKGISVGYGTQRLENNKPVPLKVKGKPFCITKERAITLNERAIQLKTDLVLGLAYEEQLEINQEMLDALVSFTYNIGFNGFYRSTVLKQLKAGKCKAAVKSLLTYNKASGEVLKGLTIRRSEEAKLLKEGCAKLSDVYKDMKPKIKKVKK